MIGPKRHCTLSNLMLNDKELQWVQELKYLGITLVSNNGFSISLESVRRKYFAALNALNAHCKSVAEPIKLQLYESYCLPILMYGLDCVDLSTRQVHELNVCWNNAYRKIFGYKYSESVKILIFFMQRIDFKKLYDLKRMIFVYKLSQLKHDIISNLLPSFLVSAGVSDLYSIYDVTESTRPNTIKKNVYRVFEECAVH